MRSRNSREWKDSRRQARRTSQLAEGDQTPFLSQHSSAKIRARADMVDQVQVLPSDRAATTLEEIMQAYF